MSNAEVVVVQDPQQQAWLDALRTLLGLSMRVESSSLLRAMEQSISRLESGEARQRATRNIAVIAEVVQPTAELLLRKAAVKAIERTERAMNQRIAEYSLPIPPSLAELRSHSDVPMMALRAAHVLLRHFLDELPLEMFGEVVLTDNQKAAEWRENFIEWSKGDGKRIAVQILEGLYQNKYVEPLRDACLRTPTGDRFAAFEAMDGGSDILAAVGSLESAIAETGQVNGPRALDELERLVAAAQAAVDKYGYGNVPAELQDLVDVAERRLAEVRSTREVIRQIASPSADFAETGVWNTEGAIRVKRPDAANRADGRSVGLPGTSEEQIRRFAALVDREASRSPAFAALLREVMNSGTQLDMFIAKNSCGFCDDPNTLTVDIDDFESLPEDPVERTFEVDGGTVTRRLGPTRGEILMHVLEERLYMFQGGLGDNQPYEVAHYECLKPNSFQNQYRREHGIEGHCVDLDCKHTHGHDDFVSVDSGGVTSKVPNINIHKASRPEVNAGYQPPAASDMEFELEDPKAEAKRQIKKIETILLDRAAADSKLVASCQFPPRGGRPKGKELVGLEHWYSVLVGGDAVEVEKLKTRFNDRCSSYGAECARERDQKTQRASDALGRPPANDQSRRLAEARTRRRDVTTNTPAAGSKEFQFREVNCALMTLGALGETGATGAVERYLESVLPEDRRGEIKKFNWVQDQTMFWRAENGFLDVDQKKFGETDGMPANESSEEVGDAQFRGIRNMIADIARTKGAGGDEYEVVQDGWPDPDGLLPFDDMKARMAKFPDGTQFQCFVQGKLQHWIYAEKFNGDVVFTDYQCNPPLSYAGADAPHHPVSGVPDAFARGMFLAIKRKADPVVDHTPLRSPDWPDPGSAAARVIEEAVRALNAAGQDLASLLDACEREGPRIQKEGDDGWAAELRRNAEAAFAAARADRPVQATVDLALDAALKTASRLPNGQHRRIVRARVERFVQIGLKNRQREIAAAEAAERQRRQEQELQERLERQAALWTPVLGRGSDAKAVLDTLVRAEAGLLEDGDRSDAKDFAANLELLAAQAKDAAWSKAVPGDLPKVTALKTEWDGLVQDAAATRLKLRSIAGRFRLPVLKEWAADQAENSLLAETTANVRSRDDLNAVRDRLALEESRRAAGAFDWAGKFAVCEKALTEMGDKLDDDSKQRLRAALDAVGVTTGTPAYRTQAGYAAVERLYEGLTWRAEVSQIKKMQALTKLRVAVSNLRGGLLG